MCSTCTIANIKVSPIPSRSNRHTVPSPSSATQCAATTRILYADLFGPLPKSFGNRYYLLLSDGDTAMLSGYGLASKDDAIDYVKDGIRTVDADKRYKNVQLQMLEHTRLFDPIDEATRHLRTDAGTEFVNHELQTWLRQHGIIHQVTAPYTPRHHGDIERGVDKVKRLTRALMFHARLGVSFWIYAVRMAVQILNFTYNRSLQGIPYIAYHGIVPNLEDVRTFGCTAYAHVPKQQRQHGLDNHGRISRLLGMNLRLDGRVTSYILYDARKNSVFSSRDVIFDEGLFTSRVRTLDPISGSPIRTGTLVHDDSSSDDDNDVSSLEIFASNRSQQRAAPVISDTANAQECDDSSDEEQVAVVVIDDLSAPPPRLMRAAKLGPKYYTGTKPIYFTFVSPQGGVRHCNALVTTETPRQCDPKTYSEAMLSPQRELWELAIAEEISSLVENKFGSLVSLPPGKRALKTAFIFKTKYKADNSIERAKVRMVAKGYSQQEGIDYKEVYAPTVKPTSIRILLYLAAVYDWEVLDQLDIKTAFLYGSVDEDIYIEQPKGWIQVGREQMVYKLDKALYGLKQAPRQWYQRLRTYLASRSYNPLRSDHCLFQCIKGDHKIILAVFVDDIVITGTCRVMANEIKSALATEFSIKDIGQLDYYLGMQVTRNREQRLITMSQSTYIKNVVDRFNLGDSKPVSSPMIAGQVMVQSDPDKWSAADIELMKSTNYPEMVGSLMHAAVYTRPDVAFSVSQLARFMACPGPVHVQACKRVMRYLKGTDSYSLKLGGESRSDFNCVLVSAFCDANWAACTDTRKSVTGYTVSLSPNELGTISWSSKMQPSVSLSTAEAEFYACSLATQEVLFIRSLISELGVPMTGPTNIKSDSTAAIGLVKNPITHSRAKHIDLRYHFIRDEINRGVITVEHVSGDKNVADIFTKGLPVPKHNEFTTRLGLG